MPKKPRKRLSDDRLKAYSEEHLYYELDMFIWSASILSQGLELVAPTRNDATRMNNALLETFVLHLRNLIVFLAPAKVRRTDVVAEDFCETWTPPSSDTLKTARRRANTHLAHLTTYRLSGNDPSKGWDFVGLRDEILAELRRFLNPARPESVSDRVRALIPSAQR